MLCILNEPVVNNFQHVPNIWEDKLWCADIPENELQHDIFTVQGEKSPEKAQRYHAELQHTQIRKLVRQKVIIQRDNTYECQFIHDMVTNADIFFNNLGLIFAKNPHHNNRNIFLSFSSHEKPLNKFLGYVEKQ